MAEKLEISIEIIAHATEDVGKILEPFSEHFEIPEKEFSQDDLTGHFENPITILRTKIKKKYAWEFFEKFVSKIPDNDFSQIIENIESHLQDSTLYLRFGKQDFINGKMVIQEKDAIKFKIYKPVYMKNDIVKNYVSLFTGQK